MNIEQGLLGLSELENEKGGLKGRLSSFSTLCGANVFCLPALGSLGHVKLDGLSFLQAAESARLNG